MTAPLISEAQYEAVYQNILEKIPIGRFQLDAEDGIVYVDDAWLALYGYAPNERNLVLEHSIRDRYVDDTELQLCEKIKKEPSEKPVARTCLLKKKTGEHFFAEVHTQGIWDEQGRYMGRFGFVRDVTAREVYERIDKKLPVAFYIVRKVHWEEQVVFCNKAFLKLYGFDAITDALGYRVVDLFQNRKDYDEFIEKGHAQPVLPKQRTKVQTSKGEPFTVESHVYFDKHERYGVLRDASQEDQLFEAIANMNLTIHTYHTAIHGMVLLTEVFIKYLLHDPDTDVTEISLQPDRRILNERIVDLMAVIDKLSNQAEVRGAAGLLAPLQRPLDILTGRVYGDFPWEALLDSKLDTTIIITRLVDDELWPRESFNRELLREVKKHAQIVAETIMLILLYRTRRHLIELGEEIQQLLAYATDASKKIKGQGNEAVNLWTLVRNVMNQEQSFAEASHIKLEYHAVERDANVWGQRAELASVIAGLIHNAIKYSWQGARRYVRIRLTRTRKTPRRLKLAISNYGVPIAPDEIASGDIFRYGYRGRFATDRHRPGSGIGLYHAKRVIEEHSGEITITSFPARQPAPDETLRNVPHITTVTIHLPVYHKRGDDLS